MRWFWQRNKNARVSDDWLDAGSSLLDRHDSPIRSEGYDWSVIGVVVFLLAFGTIMVFSASISMVDKPNMNVSQTHFLLRHVVSMAIALAVGLIVYNIPLRWWNRFAPVLIVLAMLLLWAVFLPGIGRTVNGARRWIHVGMNLQVSEVAKFAALIGAAYYTVKRQEFMHSLTRGLAPAAVVMFFALLAISWQPDLGAMMVVIVIVFGVLFLGGLKGWIVSLLIAGAALMASLMVYLTPWRMGRLVAYLDPWNPDYMMGKGYQLTHSLIAFGRGEWFGVGLGASIEKLHYLPEAHTDFILAVVGEELGFVGVMCVLAAFYWLVRRAFAIGRQAIRLDRPFSGLVAQGIGIWIGVQVIVNGGVATGILPTKGLTLPLVSFGGSSMLVTMAALALLLRVDRENRILMRGGSV